MNRHKTLYGRARSVFGCRIKRVWFHLNPFLERTKVKDDEQGVYQPSSKFVLPLQSIVLCEEINNESMSDWKELSPASFWDYLYSNSWGEECSLRVMEGELLEMLLTTLFALERDHLVLASNTFAYTTNTRVKPACYRQDEIKKEQIIDETILIDFTYYGKYLAYLDKDISGSTVYPFSNTTSHDFSSSGYTSSDVQSSDPSSFIATEVTSDRKGSFAPEIAGIVQPGPGAFVTRPPKSVKFDVADIQIVDSGILGIKGPLRTIPVSSLANVSPFDTSGSSLMKSFTRDSSQLMAKKRMSSSTTKVKPEQESSNAVPPTAQRARRQSIQQSKMPTVFEKKGKHGASAERSEAAPAALQNSESATDSTESSETGLPLLEFNLARLSCSERTTAGLENWKLDKYAYIRKPPGDEYYLRFDDISGERLPVQGRLAKKKRKFHAERDNNRNELEEVKDVQTKDTEEEQDVEVEDKPFKPVLKYFDHVPTFMEFLQWLEEENKFDPRFKKQKQRKKEIVKKYKLKFSDAQISRTSVGRSSVETRSSVIEDAEVCQRRPFRRRMIFPVNDEAVRFAEEAGGVTDSKGVRNTLLANIQLNQESAEELSPLGGHISRPPKPRRLSTTPEPPPEIPPPTLTKPQDNTQRLAPEKDSTAKGRSLTSVKSKTASKSSLSKKNEFKKSDFKMQGKEFDLETESADTDTDDEEDGLEDSLFDSNKLNKRYSFEKLKGKNCHKKKPVFFDILKKYYRVQKVMNALRGPAKKSSMATTSSSKAPLPKSSGPKPYSVRKAPQASMLRRLSQRPVKPKIKMVLGQLKTFKFQQYKNHQPKVLQLDLPDFSVYPVKDFVTHLLKALDDFVIRKENVITSYGQESLTTVTFTRPKAFMKMLHIN